MRREEEEESEAERVMEREEEREAGLFVQKHPQFRSSNLNVIENRLWKRPDKVCVCVTDFLVS